MRRNNKHIALFLLAVYLPMWLLSAFHVHTERDVYCNVANEQQTGSSSDYDEDDCLLCQFLQQPYEEATQVTLQANLPVFSVQEVMPTSILASAFEGLQVSRAPPFCL